MQKFFKIFFFSILFFFFISLANATRPTDLQNIFNKKTIVIAMYANNYPPFFYQTKNGQLEGIDIEMAKDIAKHLGVIAVFERSAKSFDDVIKMLASNKADIGLGALSISLNRALDVNFTNPYYKVPLVALVNRVLDVDLDNNKSNAVNNSKLKFACLENSSYVPVLKENGHLFSPYFTLSRLKTYTSIPKAFDDLMKGNIYAFYIDDNYAQYFLDSESSSRLFIRKDILAGQYDYLSIAVPWQSSGLHDWLNIYIQMRGGTK